MPARSHVTTPASSTRRSTTGLITYEDDPDNLVTGAEIRLTPEVGYSLGYFDLLPEDKWPTAHLGATGD